ncbi:MAG: barstar family protein [Nannocystaceae bacterium]
MFGGSEAVVRFGALPMAVFQPEDCNRLDFEILAEGGVALYFQHEVLGEDLAWLALERYEVVQFDEEALESVEGFHFEARLKLGFPEGYEPTLEDLRDSMSEIEVPDEGGVALVLLGVERIAADDLEGLRSIVGVISDLSHEFLLTGHRLVTLLQSEDPELDLGSLGARSVLWNPRERMPWTRGL